MARLPPDIFAEGSKYMRDSVWFDGMGTFAADIERIMDTADRLAKQRNHGKAPTEFLRRIAR